MFALFLALADAGAQDVAHVLRIDGAEAYVDLSVDDHLAKGDAVYLYRIVEVRDPEGRAVSDRFLLGSAQVLEVGETLSLVRADPNVMLQLSVGDVVSAQKLAPPTPPERTVEPVSEPAPVVVRPLVEVAECPEPADVAEPEPVVVEPEPEPEPEPPPKPVVKRARLPFQASGPAELWQGESLRVVATVPDVGRVAAVRLFFRRSGEEGYRQVEMKTVGDTAFSAYVPEEAAVERVEWWVAVEDTDGWEHTSQQSAEEPGVTVVSEDVPLSRPRAGRTELAVRYDWVDFYQLEGSDRMQRVEADVLYRLDRPLHAVRLGFGRWSGVSRPMATIDDETTSVAAGFQYGFLELEVPLGVDWLSVSGRGMAGVYEGGLEGGVQGQLRVGPEEGTSVQFGAARVGPLGQEYGIGLAWNTVPRVPMRADVLVTNLPAADPDEYGLHLVWEGRYAVTRWAEIGLRLGYPLRSVHHTGLSAGGSAVLSW